MNTIGIRVSPTAIVFAVFDSTNNIVKNVESLNVPSALDVPETLKYIRNQILDIIREYEVVKAGIRVTEASSQNLSIRRIEIEGVIQETFASSFLEKFFTGQISTIAAKLGIPRADFKRYVDGEIPYPNIENWTTFNKEKKEAVLTAIGACNA